MGLDSLEKQQIAVDSHLENMKMALEYNCHKLLPLKSIKSTIFKTEVKQIINNDKKNHH